VASPNAYAYITNIRRIRHYKVAAMVFADSHSCPDGRDGRDGGGAAMGEPDTAAGLDQDSRHSFAGD
jgi:hypothetical protein